MTVNVGDILECSVVNITSYGAFVVFDDNQKGLIHISEISNKYVEDANTDLSIGQVVKAKVLSIDNGKISLSIKQVENDNQKKYSNKKEYVDYSKKSDNNQPKTFEDILSKFMKDSEERQTDLKRNFESKRGCSSKRI